MIIPLFHQKGGVGKTTSVQIMGRIARHLGKKTCLIDLDPQGNLTQLEGFEEDENLPTISDVIEDLIPIRDAIIKRENYPDIIISNNELAGVRIGDDQENTLKNRLKEIKNEYDFIFIDCPPALGMLTINALTAADRTIITCQTHRSSLKGMAATTKIISDIKEYLNPTLEVERIIPTLHENRTLHARECLAALKKDFGDLVSRPIDVTVKIRDAGNAYETIYEYDPNHKVSITYELIVKEMIMNVT